jgi:hypothetical protein
MIDDRLVGKWIQTVKVIDTTPHMPSPDEALLSLRVTLEELFEQAEAFGADFLSEFSDIVISAAHKQKEKSENPDKLNVGMIALRDAIADTFVTACNMPTYAGLLDTTELDFNEVMRSNFTKFCTTESDAILSVEKYTKEWRETSFKQVGEYYVILDANTGKILKWVHYEDPNLV